MRVIIAGSRSINNCEQQIIEVLKEIKQRHNFVTLEIISGGARGVDKCAKDFAIKYGIRYKEFPAEWNKYGKSAGPIRNQKMIDYAKEGFSNYLIAIWDGYSRGTKDIIDRAIKNDIPYVRIIVK